MDSDKPTRQFGLHELEPGERPRDALDWVRRELSEIDRLISEALAQPPKNNSG
jgi:hypothetical protein